MNNKAKLIVFTGGCHSGKTSSINVIENILKQQNKSVISLSELIREYNIDSIDNIRKDPNAYVDIQYNIITGKILAEIDAKASDYDFILIDRSVTDSLFYLTFYVDKNNLDAEHQQKFIKLFHYLNNYLKNINNIYSYIFEFVPIRELQENDSFRPQNLKDFQEIEYEMIKKYNNLYFGNNKRYIQINLNGMKLENLSDFWNNKLKELNI